MITSSPSGMLMPNAQRQENDRGEQDEHGVCGYEYAGAMHQNWK